MSNNKQSSIEWLEDKLNNVKPTEFCSIETIKEWVEQAKQMHKAEMIQFATDYLDSKCYASFNGNVECACSVEEYYEQTYGGNK